MKKNFVELPTFSYGVKRIVNLDNVISFEFSKDKNQVTLITINNDLYVLNYEDDDVTYNKILTYLRT